MGLLCLSPALADTKQELDRAKAELAAIQADLDRATAAWNAAMTRLNQTKSEIIETRVRISDIEQNLERIDARLARRAVLAFTTGPAGTIDLLLSSGSFVEFSDRLEFLGSVAQDDVDLALERQVAQAELQRQRGDLLSLEQRQVETAGQLNAARGTSTRGSRTTKTGSPSSRGSTTPNRPPHERSTSSGRRRSPAG